MTMTEALANATTNLPTLDARVATLRTRLASLKARELDQVEEAFKLLVWVDFNCTAIEQQLPGSFGFADHDTRYLRSLRDQMVAKPLTKAQLQCIKVTLQSDHYLHQLALLMQ